MLNCAPTKRTPVLVLLTGHYKEVEAHIQARTDVIVPVTSDDSNTNDKNEAKVKKIRRMQECAARLKKATRVLFCFKTSSQK